MRNRYIYYGKLISKNTTGGNNKSEYAEDDAKEEAMSAVSRRDIEIALINFNGILNPFPLNIDRAAKQAVAAESCQWIKQAGAKR